MSLISPESALVVPLRFQSFTPEHGLLLGIFAVGVIGFALLGRRLGTSPRGIAFARGYAVLIPLVTVPMQVLQLLPEDFGLGTSLPIQVCDLSWMLAVYALWTRAPLATGLLYFWGLTLTLQGVITPSLDENFPDPRYFMFWAMHLLTIWAAVYLVAAVGGPTWKGYRFAVVVTAIWAGSVMVFNGIAETNYGYLNEKPGSASLLDLMGPWPVYVVVEVVVLAGIWALMTLPWVRAGRKVPERQQVTHPEGL